MRDMMIFRLLSLLVLIISIGTSAYFRRQARVGGKQIPRAAEPVSFRVLRAVVAVPLFVGPLLYILDPDWMAWSSFDAPTWMRWAGALLGLVVIAASQWVMRSLGRNVSETVLTKDQQELVTVGPYRWIRHPLYTTGILLFASIGLMAASWFILLFTLIAAIMIRFVVIPVEERELVARFGDGYRDYSRRTGRLLPRFR
jgi:protein-S-isoprenylcysteine O-methyltransferase Ste14